MTQHADLELRVQTLEQMLEITMTTLLKVASSDQRQTLQKLLADVGRENAGNSSPAWRFVGAASHHLTCVATISARLRTCPEA